MLESHPVEGEQVLFKGSMIIYTGESTEEVKEIINKDIYAKSGVWDLEKAQIIPVYISHSYICILWLARWKYADKNGSF